MYNTLRLCQLQHTICKRECLLALEIQIWLYLFYVAVKHRLAFITVIQLQVRFYRILRVLMHCIFVLGTWIYSKLVSRDPQVLFSLKNFIFMRPLIHTYHLRLYGWRSIHRTKISCPPSVTKLEGIRIITKAN